MTKCDITIHQSEAKARAWAGANGAVIGPVRMVNLVDTTTNPESNPYGEAKQTDVWVAAAKVGN